VTGVQTCALPISQIVVVAQFGSLKKRHLESRRSSAG
jgi:hypothetical protein